MSCWKCWETPCVCPDAAGYRHLSLNELKAIRSGLDALIIDKTKRGVKPDQREHE